MPRKTTAKKQEETEIDSVPVRQSRASDEVRREDESRNYSYSQPPKKNYLTYTLVVLLIVASFFIGNLYTRVKLLEKGGAPTGGTTAGTGGTAPQADAAAPAVKADLKIEDSDPVMGDKNAKLVVYSFEDFQCPFCGAVEGHNEEMVKSMQSRDATWQPAMPNIIKDYVNTGKVKLVWKDYPFLGDESFKSAEAARCAQEQGKFWEFHEYLFSHQKGENQGAFSNDNLKKFAADLGLDTGKFNTCFDSGKYADQMKKAMSYGQGVGVSGTPATFINGKMLAGAASYSDFKTAIEEGLK
jgi:protein-disulfide isomerase